MPIVKPTHTASIIKPSGAPPAGVTPISKTVVVKGPVSDAPQSPPIGTGFAPNSDVTIRRQKVAMSHPDGPGSYLFEKTETTEHRGGRPRPPFAGRCGGPACRPPPHLMRCPFSRSPIHRGPPILRGPPLSNGPPRPNGMPLLPRGGPPHGGCPFMRPPMRRGLPPMELLRRSAIDGASKRPSRHAAPPPPALINFLKDVADRLDKSGSAPGGRRIISLSGPRMVPPMGRPPMMGRPMGPPTGMPVPIVIKAIKND